MRRESRLAGLFLLTIAFELLGLVLCTLPKSGINIILCICSAFLSGISFVEFIRG